MPGQPALRAGLPALAMAALAACGADDSSFAERQELANTHPAVAMDKVAGPRLVKTFQQFCLEGSPDPAARTARLRAAGFVPAGGWHGNVRDFVTDDRRPLVRLSRDGKSCAVRARATTGQTVAIHGAIGKWFPQAVQVRNSDITQIWQTGRKPGEGIAITRSGLGPQRNEIMLALIQL